MGTPTKEARRAAEDAELDAYAQRMADAAPPLTPAQRHRIAALLHRRRRPAPAR